MFDAESYDGEKVVECISDEDNGFGPFRLSGE